MYAITYVDLRIFMLVLAVPSRVQNLRTSSISDNSVSITWQEPITTNGIVSYTIEVREYRAGTGRDLVLLPLNPEVKRSIPVSMLSGMFLYTLAEGLGRYQMNVGH